jgi:hypothetical protein
MRERPIRTFVAFVETWVWQPVLAELGRGKLS